MNHNTGNNPPIQGQLQVKLKGLISFNQRVWNHVKDRPGSTSKDLTLLMKDEPHKVTLALSGMFARGMLTREHVPASRHKGHGGANKRYAYTVPAKFTEFELLPLPKGKVEPSTPPPGAAQQAPASKVKKMIDGMTIAEARELHQTFARIKKLQETLNSTEMVELQGALGILFKS